MAINIRKEAASRGQTVTLIDPRKIKVMPTLNARDMKSTDTLAHVAALADSIEAQGFLGSHPLEVFAEGDAIYVAAGHCRLAACLLVIERGVNIEAVPCLTEARGTNPAQRLLNQITSNTGQRLNLAEEGKVYHRLVAMGYIIAKIAREAGRSEAHIRHAIDFNAAPAEAHALVSDGRVSATLAASTIRKEGASKGVAKLKAAVKTAEKDGRKKATLRHVEPKTGVAAPDAAACVTLVERMARMTDPMDSDHGEDHQELMAFSRLIEEAKAICGPPRRDLAKQIETLGADSLLPDWKPSKQAAE